MYTQHLLRRIARTVGVGSLKLGHHSPSFSIHRQFAISDSNHHFFSTIGDESQKHKGIRILYASQTGTAQLFAHQLAEGLEDDGVDNVSVLGLDEGPAQDMLSPGHLHLLLTSCTGAGEPPDHSREFYNWIMKNPDTKPLSGDISYAVFGLGNEACHPNNYNVIGKQLDARLSELGAKRVREIGLGDDGGCIDDDFDKWMELYPCHFSSFYLFRSKVSRLLLKLIKNDSVYEFVWEVAISRIGRWQGGFIVMQSINHSSSPSYGLESASCIKLTPIFFEIMVCTFYDAMVWSRRRLCPIGSDRMMLPSWNHPPELVTSSHYLPLDEPGCLLPHFRVGGVYAIAWASLILCWICRPTEWRLRDDKNNGVG